MSKIKLFFYTLFIMVITATGTVFMTNKNALAMVSDYDKLDKLLFLKKIITQNYYKEVNEEDLIEGAEKGLLMGLDDPYSEYLTKEDMDTLREETEGEFIGIGIIVTNVDDNITVISPIKDTPAMKHGIKPGDIIVKVGDETFSGKQLNDAINKIKVPIDKKKKILGNEDYGSVHLTILRGEELIEMDVERKTIPYQTVDSKMQPDKIGYIEITQFAEGTAKDFKKALKKLQDEKMQGLIIDLRNNPGGLVDEVAEVADSIMGEATVVYTQNRAGEKSYIKSDEKGQLDIPLVLLVNEGSASASEILSGAVRDNEIGKLVGEKTFGKGLVQIVQELNDGTGYKLTTEQYFTPKGENINKKGIKPDYEIKLDEEKFLKENKDTQLEKAIEVVKTMNK